MTSSLLVQGNSLRIPLADGSVHCAISSSPYWGLRSYLTGPNKVAELGSEPLHDCAAWAKGEPPCGACFVCHMRAVFAEVWRVLRDDGTLWLNLGDSYSSGAMNNHSGLGENAVRYNELGTVDGSKWAAHRPIPYGLKPKDLVGIPWRVALALQADGWFLRSDIIWAKPNPMPESVTDRPTKAHEYIFLLTKSARYAWDQGAVREGHVSGDWSETAERMHKLNAERRAKQDVSNELIPRQGGRDSQFINPPNTAGRNLRTVWTIATAPFSGSHFATFPPALPERCIKAGTSEAGCCSVCGRQWERVEKKEKYLPTIVPDGVRFVDDTRGDKTRKISGREYNKQAKQTTTGFRPTCACSVPVNILGEMTMTHPPAIPCIVLDPFNGAGTTGLVAQQLGRRYIGLDLSAEYLQMSRERLGHVDMDAWTNGKPSNGKHDLAGLPMFEEATK